MTQLMQLKEPNSILSINKIKDDKVEPEVAKSERIDLLCEKVERLENILLAIEGKLT